MVEVGQYMSRPVHSIPYNATVQMAAERMRELKVGSLLVTKAGKHAGIITDGDMTRKVIPQGVDALLQRVESFMSAPLLSIDVYCSIEEANRMMKENRVRHLAVTEKGKTVGLLSVRDLVRYFNDFFRMEEAALTEKRGYLRLPFTALVTFEDQKKKRFESITYDISAGGLFIQTRSPLPMGSRISMELMLPRDRKGIRSGGIIAWLRRKAEALACFPITKAAAEVTYVREKMQRKTVYPGMGVKFTDISEEDRIKIMHFITTWVEKITPTSK